MAWIDEFLQTWIYKLRSVYRCRPMQIFLWRYKFSRGPRSASANQKYFCLPAPPPKIRPPIKVRPQFIDSPPYRPLPPRRGKLMPNDNPPTTVINPQSVALSAFKFCHGCRIALWWWNTIRPTSSLNVAISREKSFQSFLENYISVYLWSNMLRFFPLRSTLQKRISFWPEKRYSKFILLR